MNLIQNSNTLSREHVLKYDDILKLEGIGWIEYTLPFSILTDNNMEWIQPSIDMKNHSIIMVCFFFNENQNITIIADSPLLINNLIFLIKANRLCSIRNI